MPRYTCTCPHCAKSATDTDYTKAMCTIPHDENCGYIKGCLPTKMEVKFDGA